MGASSYIYEFGKKVTQSFLSRELRERQEHDRCYNGDEDGYTGDSQTVSSVRLHDHEVFKSYDAAQEYILENAQKWEYFVAVYYRHERKTRTLVGGWAAE